MKGIQARLTITSLSAALLLFAYFGTTLFTFPISFLYRSAPGLDIARNVTQIAALAAAVCVFAGAAIIAISAALQPASWVRKLLYVLPASLLTLMLTGLIFNIVGIGTTGSVFNNVPNVTFATVWLAVGVVLSTIALVMATARMNLSPKTLKSAMTTLGIAGVPSLIAWLGMVISIVIVMTSQPSLPSFGGPNGPPGAPPAQARPAASGTPSAQRAPGAQGTPAASGTPRAPGGPGGTGGPGGPDGLGGPGGPGGTAGLVGRLEIGGVLMTVFAAIELVGIAAGLRALRGMATKTSIEPLPVARPDYRREVGRAVVSGIVIAVVALAAMQLAPVSRTNPPVQTTVQWDSAQTQELASRTCMDCHSNQTRWPWYSNIAPPSWLNVLHVTDARQQYNLSELNNLPSFRRARLADDMAQAIRMGTMPPKDYLLLHPEAQLSDTEKQQLIQGLQNSLARSP